MQVKEGIQEHLFPVESTAPGGLAVPSWVLPSLPFFKLFFLPRRATGAKAGPSWQRLEEFDASPNLVTRSEPELSFNGEKLLFQATEPESLS